MPSINHDQENYTSYLYLKSCKDEDVSEYTGGKIIPSPTLLPCPSHVLIPMIYTLEAYTMHAV